MTFWLEREWQGRCARRICAALDSVNDELLPLKLKDGAWTKPMFAAVAPVALELCREHATLAACSFGGGESLRHRKGWLYDFCCWVTDGEERLLGLPVVVESEWLAWSQVLDDFEKLLQARAGLRVLVFQRDNSTPPNWRDELLARVQTFAESNASDVYLFAFWSDGRFSYASNLWD